MADDALKLKIKIDTAGGQNAINNLDKINERIEKATELSKELAKAFAEFKNMTKGLDTLASATKTFSSAFKEVSNTTKTSVSNFDKLSKTLSGLEQNQAKLKIQEEKLNQAKLKTIDLSNKEVASYEKAVQAMAKTEMSLNKLENSNKKVAQSTFSMKVALANFIALQADRIVSNLSRQLFEFAKSCSKAGVELDALRNTFMAATGGWQQGQQEMKWLIGMSNNLGVAFGDVSDSYAKFMTSFTRSGGTISQSRQIFEDLSTAMVSLHLPAERMQGVFIALEQMANKGTVQAEELKRQLGNALPGAFELAAESMGILPSKLMDMMKAGEVFSKDFLPNFAATVKDALGQSIDIASQQYNANMARLKTATDLFKMSLGQLLNQALLPFVKALVPMMNTLAQATESFNQFSQSVFSGNSAESYMGMSAQIVQLTKSVAGLNLENQEAKKIFEENAAILPMLSKHIVELNKSFVDLSDEELRQIASMGQVEAMEQILTNRTKELNTWQNTLQATWNVVWTNIKTITVGVAKGIWDVIKKLGEAIKEWFTNVFGWVGNFYKQIHNVYTRLKKEREYALSWNKDEYNKGLFDDFKNSIQSEKESIALQHAAKAMDNLGNSTKNTYAALKIAQTSARGLSDELSDKKKKGSKGYQKTEAEKEFSKLKHEKSALEAKSATSGLSEAEKKRYQDLTTLINNNKQSLKGLTLTKAEEYELIKKGLTAKEEEIKLGLINGQNVEKLAFDYRQQKNQLQEIDEEFNRLTGDYSSGWQTIENKLKRVKNEYKYMVTHVQEFTSAQIQATKQTLKQLDALSKYGKAKEKIEETLQSTKQTAKDFTGTIIDNLFSALDGTSNFWESLKESGISALKAIATEWTKTLLDQMLASFSVGFSGAGGYQGGLLDGFKALFQGVLGGGFNTGSGTSGSSSSDGSSGIFGSVIQEAQNLSTVLNENTGTAISNATEQLSFLKQGADVAGISFNSMSSPVMNVATGVIGMAQALPIANIGMGTLSATMKVASSTFQQAAPAMQQMSSAMSEIATSAANAATSMASLAVSTAAESVAKIPYVGGFLAPVAAALTGAAIAAGTIMTGVGIAASSSIAGAGQGLGSGLSGLGSSVGKLFGGKTTAYAKGGVVSSPTTFPTSGGGVGLAGEAGTEVIAPARRMSNGDMGIGAVQPKVTVNNYANAAVEVIKRPDNEMEIKIKELNAMLSSSRSNKGFTNAQQRLSTKGKQIG